MLNKLHIVSNNLEETKSSDKSPILAEQYFLVGTEDWKYVIYDIPLDNTRHHTGTVTVTDGLEDARQTYFEKAEKSMGRFVMLAHVSPELLSLLEQNPDLEKIVEIISKNKSEHKRILCNFVQ